MTKRPSISRTKRLRIFNTHGGICHLCKRPIGVGEAWEIEHPKARGLGGSDDEKDLRPAHVDCHKPKTKEDRGRMAKADKAGKAHRGVVSKSRLSRPRQPRPVADPEAKVRRLKAAHEAHKTKRRIG